MALPRCHCCSLFPSLCRGPCCDWPDHRQRAALWPAGLSLRWLRRVAGRTALLGGHWSLAPLLCDPGGESPPLGVDTLKGRALQRGEWPDERGVGWGGGGGKGRPDAASFCPHLEQPLPSVFPSLDWTVLWPFLLRACPCSPPIKCSCQVAP